MSIRFHRPNGNGGRSVVTAVALAALLSACSAPRWPDTVEYERLQNLGMQAMATTLGDRQVVHEAVPLYLRTAPRDPQAATDPSQPVAWQFEVVRLATDAGCGPVFTPGCAELGLTLRYDATPGLPSDVRTDLGVVWAVWANRPTALPEGLAGAGGTSRWIRHIDDLGHPLMLRSVSFQGSRAMTITWRYRSKDALDKVSPWVEQTTVIVNLDEARAAFCATVRNASSQRPEVQRTVLVNDGCEPAPSDPTVSALMAPQR